MITDRCAEDHGGVLPLLPIPSSSKRAYGRSVQHEDFEILLENLIEVSSSGFRVSGKGLGFMKLFSRC